MVKITHFCHFASNFLVFCLKSYLKSALQDKNQIYTSISALFSFKNDQNWEIFTIFSILPYTDGFFGSIFYILGIFAKIPPPLLLLQFQGPPPPPPPPILPKISKKVDLSDKPGQTNLKKMSKWLDLVKPSVEGKMEKMAKFWSFFWGKRPVYQYKFDF